MRIDFTWPPLLLLAVLVAACSALERPDDRATPRGDDESMEGREPEDAPPRVIPRVTLPPPVQSCEATGSTFPSCGVDPEGGIDAGPGSDGGSGTDVGSGTDAGTEAASCEAAGQNFPAGSDVPSGDDCNTCTCEDGSITCTERACDPVFCAVFVEESDGVCSRFSLDPCIAQDPDCNDTPGATAP